MGRKRGAPTQTVSFRFGQADLEALSTRAEAVQLSPADFVRKLIRARLASEDALEGKLLEMEGTLEALRDDLAEMRREELGFLKERLTWFNHVLPWVMASLLCDAGKASSMEEALDSVENMLRQATAEYPS